MLGRSAAYLTHGMDVDNRRGAAEQVPRAEQHLAPLGSPRSARPTFPGVRLHCRPWTAGALPSTMKEGEPRIKATIHEHRNALLSILQFRRGAACRAVRPAAFDLSPVRRIVPVSVVGS